jgi:hypothetical protein
MTFVLLLALFRGRHIDITSGKGLLDVCHHVVDPFVAEHCLPCGHGADAADGDTVLDGLGCSTPLTRHRP